MVAMHTLFTNLTPLCHIMLNGVVCSLTVAYDWFPVIGVNRDGCHMWGRKCFGNVPLSREFTKRVGDRLPAPGFCLSPICP